MTASLCSSPLFIFIFILLHLLLLFPCQFMYMAAGRAYSLWSICHLPPPPQFVMHALLLFCFWGVGACLNYMGLCTIFCLMLVKRKMDTVSVTVYLWVQFCLTVVCEVEFLAHIKMMQVCFSVNCTFETLHGHLFLALYYSVTLFFCVTAMLGNFLAVCSLS